MFGLTNQQLRFGLFAIAALVFVWPWLRSAFAAVRLPRVSIPWNRATASHDHEHFTPDEVLRFAAWLQRHGNSVLAQQLVQLPTSYYVCPDEVAKLEPAVRTNTEEVVHDPDIEP